LTAERQPRLRVILPSVPVPTARAAPAGEPKLAGELFERYAPYVARVALRILGRDSEVDDVVQDVFSVVVDKADQLPQLLSPRHWLAGITVRRARQILRWRRVRRLVGALSPIDHETIADGGASPAQRESVLRVARALDQLAPDVRIAWTLRYIEQEPLEDVARICECSLSTVKRRIGIAQERLRKVIGDA
jgi:RNA polymerase sigma-70 factor (ECF subfamily)